MPVNFPLFKGLQGIQFLIDYHVERFDANLKSMVEGPKDEKFRAYRRGGEDA